jgi:hypothetical protein
MKRDSSLQRVKEKAYEYGTRKGNATYSSKIDIK